MGNGEFFRKFPVLEEKPITYNIVNENFLETDQKPVGSIAGPALLWLARLQDCLPSGVVFLMASQYLLKNDKAWPFSTVVSPRMTSSEGYSLGTGSSGYSSSCWIMD